MFAGHFAAGLAIKAREPRAPTWAVLLGVGVCDVLFGLFVAVGIERVTMTPGVSPGFRLDFIDWSHSMVMSLVWAAAFGLLFIRRGRGVAIACGVAVFSHFVLDLVMHPGDLRPWPYSTTHLGFGLWNETPLWWFVELAVIGACAAYYLMSAKKHGTFGGRGRAVIGVVLALHVFNSPWLAPT